MGDKRASLRYNVSGIIEMPKNGEELKLRAIPQRPFCILTTVKLEKEGGVDFEEKGHEGRWLSLKRSSSEETNVEVHDKTTAGEKHKA
ncbi:hypothetical protein MHYP_G00219690 [Metynnis hypsauchen]